ncbi:MAG TPA: heavy metal-binding domain-containing protein [Panacibacter sp.]|nr:heavy metal-binding domain-containing protein [Panacibacter sp.]
MKAIKMLMMAALTIVSFSLFAQDSTKQKTKAPKQKMEMMKYSCPMHPDVTSKKPGKCTKCGMDMTKSKKEQMKMEVMKMYTCPMHPDVTSDKPGKCSKCGMDLKEKEQATVAYSCPMKCEGDKTYDKPGKCPKCGMALKEQKKDDHSNHKH